MAAIVRAARLADATAIARVNVDAWQVGYADLLPGDFLGALDVADRAERWRQWQLTDDPGRRLLVADRAGDVVGFAASWPTPDADLDPATGELAVLNVRSDQWGAGVGGALLAATVEALAGDGHPAASLWVITGNTRARAFYEHLGWRPDGAHRVLHAPGARFEQVRYRRAL
jgi:GNAT superfamily N-acetyltransferase